MRIETKLKLVLVKFCVFAGTFKFDVNLLCYVFKLFLLIINKTTKNSTSFTTLRSHKLNKSTQIFLELWSPISEQAAKSNNKKDHSRLIFLRYQTATLIWLRNVCTNLIVKPFSRNKNKTLHTFYFDIKLSLFFCWLMMMVKKWISNWMQKGKLNNKLAIHINSSPTRPLSVYLKRHCTPHGYQEYFIWIY